MVARDQRVNGGATARQAIAGRKRGDPQQHARHGRRWRAFLAWRFYWVHGVFTASDYVGKLQGALGRISGWGDDGANIVIYAPLSAEMDVKQAEADAAARLQVFGPG